MKPSRKETRTKNLQVQEPYPPSSPITCFFSYFIYPLQPYYCVKVIIYSHDKNCYILIIPIIIVITLQNSNLMRIQICQPQLFLVRKDSQIMQTFFFEIPLFSAQKKKQQYFIFLQRKLAYEYDQMRFTILEEIKSTLPKSLFYNYY